jgi:hypothetical protein
LAAGAGIIGITLFIATPLVYFFGVHGWAPPDRKVRLESKWPVLKPEDVARDSAYDLWRRAVRAQPKESPPPEFSNEVNRLNAESWSETAFPVLAKLLHEDETALTLARSAAKAPNPQCITYLSPYDKMGDVSASLRLTQIFNASAAQKVARGDFAGAYSELEMSMKFAQILSRGGTIVPTLVDMASERVALTAMRRIALRHDLPPKVAHRAIEALLEINGTTEPLAETYRAEYRAVPAMVDAFFDPSKPDALGLGKDKNGEPHARRFRANVIRLGSKEMVNEDLARSYKAIVEVAEEPYRASEVKRLRESLERRATPGELLLMHDRVGYLLETVTVPALLNVIENYPRRAADLKATALMLAIRQFEQAEHRLPSSLQELVPKYIAQVPIDPFDGAPLRFRVRADHQWIIYSVGPNQTDEGGEKPKKDPRHYNDPGDVVWGGESLKS